MEYNFLLIHNKSMHHKLMCRSVRQDEETITFDWIYFTFSRLRG